MFAGKTGRLIHRKMNGARNSVIARVSIANSREEPAPGTIFSPAPDTRIFSYRHTIAFGIAKKLTLLDSVFSCWVSGVKRILPSVIPMGIRLHSDALKPTPAHPPVVTRRAEQQHAHPYQSIGQYLRPMDSPPCSWPNN